MLFGYVVTAIVLASSVALILSVILGRRELSRALRPGINRYSVIGLLLVLAFFALFALLAVSPAEQLYFDENIYQGIALNILHNGNAVWCQYGSGYLTNCPITVIYHDPVGWSVFIALAFALFGVSTGTAYGLQLLVGVLSIIGVFLLSAALFQRKDLPLVASAFMALNPQLFIWSRTQAATDLPFMLLTVLTFFFFIVFIRRKNKWALSMTVFSLLLTVYTRIEAFILVPLLVILYFALGDDGIALNARAKIRSLHRMLNSRLSLSLVVILAVLLLPQLWYIVSQSEITGNYGQSTGSGLLSLTNLKANFYPNFGFFVGAYNYIYNYPAVFPVETTIAAVTGAALLALDKSRRNRFALLLLLAVWILSYYIFYDFFYAGSALYGVDVRFMLELLPPLTILAGVGIVELSTLVAGVAMTTLEVKDVKGKSAIFTYTFCILFLVILAVYPFVTLLPNTTIKPQNMPQQQVILGTMNFIYGNYTKVMPGCLVFSYNPDIWYMLNRSATQIGYLGSSNTTFTKFANNYSCFVFDYGYWCQVPPNQNNPACSNPLHEYKTLTLAVTNSSTGINSALYLLLNYTK